ncbi:hypothetical protein C8T65DRAFT_233514 [Cerioporus squamosus]|nr:hypothetical protein C8T65DRAFT_233514 [Cerioporus squamosus]
MISAYARLGHKYQIDHLLDQSLHYLKQHFTANFDRWYNRPVHKGGYVPPHFKPIHVIGVVNIARLAGCDTILPIALALCCSLNPEVLLRGFRRPDGSVEQLDHEDLIRCLVATPVLMQKTTCAVLRALRPTAKGSSGETVVTMCNSGARCQAGLRSLLYDALDANETHIANPYPFHPCSFYIMTITGMSSLSVSVISPWSVPTCVSSRAKFGTCCRRYFALRLRVGDRHGDLTSHKGRSWLGQR